MKTTILTTFIIFPLLFLSTTGGFAQNNPSTDHSFMYHIQQKIHDAMASSFRSHNPAKLKTIEKKLKAVKNNNRIVKYWRAYTLYNEAIYYMRANRKASRKAINKGIKILKNIKPKGSEDYALLAMMQGIAIQFAGRSKTVMLSRKAVENAKKAINLDKNNVRAWLVRGVMNYHTPKQFRQKTIVERCLKKAISLKEENSNNPYLPTWGKVQAYVILVAYYNKNSKFEKAKETLNAGLKQFPDNQRLKGIARRLGND